MYEKLTMLNLQSGSNWSGPNNWYHDPTGVQTQHSTGLWQHNAADILIMHHYYSSAMQRDVALVSAETDQRGTLDWMWLRKALKLSKNSVSTVHPSRNISLWSWRREEKLRNQRRSGGVTSCSQSQAPLSTSFNTSVYHQQHGSSSGKEQLTVSIYQAIISSL
ncbi:hypothetical protein GOODEAATRI_014323 [Goodea atripinnis]|uniref:Uncharacterized protein n=1 Tax=Goodea atripinnis TaxID=208336 RepID=A0ABV0NAK7_9TELE